MDSADVSEWLGIDLSDVAALVGLLVAIQAWVVFRLRRLMSRTKAVVASSFAASAAIKTVHVQADAQIFPARTSDEWNRLAHRSRISQLGEMSAAIAHEVRQPLATIVLTGQAAKRELANNRLDQTAFVEVLDDIVKAGEHAGDVIQRLQAMTRLTPTPFQEIEVNALVTDALDFFKRDLALRDVNATLKLSPGLPHVRGDAVQLRQVLGNLIRNSCDAMSQGESRERNIVLATFRGPAGQVCLAVEDSGPGLSAAALEKLFLPFQSMKPNGVGIGLGICRRIASAHHGEISGKNNSSGVGATFVLSLPPLDGTWNEGPESNEISRDDLCCR